MGEINANQSRASAGKVKRLSTRVDLTPMVDLGFLLITFFVFTTAMSRPKVMDLREPADGKPMPVVASATQTILLGKANQLYYYEGILDAASSRFRTCSFKDIRAVIRNKRNAVPGGDQPASKLMYIIKAGQESTFKNMIDLLDEMVINGIYPGHYAEADLSKEEAGLMKATEEANGIK
jgi:biopolymer transport protein ExbD